MRVYDLNCSGGSEGAELIAIGRRAWASTGSGAWTAAKISPKLTKELNDEQTTDLQGLFEAAEDIKEVSADDAVEERAGAAKRRPNSASRRPPRPSPAPKPSANRTSTSKRPSTARASSPNWSCTARPKAPARRPPRPTNASTSPSASPRPPRAKSTAPCNGSTRRPILKPFWARGSERTAASRFRCSFSPVFRHKEQRRFLTVGREAISRPARRSSRSFVTPRTPGVSMAATACPGRHRDARAQLCRAEPA